MREYLPLLIVCAVIGVFTILFLAAYAVLKRKTKEETSERHMSDSEIIKRLLGYARPYKKDFVLVFLIMLVSIAYDVVSPLLVADIQGTIKQSFELSRLYSLVAVYAGILAVSMVCTYFQAMILQKTGQKILSQIRLDTFTHIEQLSHAQLNQIPVGKLVTRVTNDPNSISYLFTNILVTLAKNSLVIIGVYPRPHPCRGGGSGAGDGGEGLQRRGLSGLKPGGLLRDARREPGGVQRDQYPAGIHLHFHVSQAV